MRFIDTLARTLAVLFAIDRLLKLAAVVHFFRRSPPPEPPRWPSVTLLQPITRGASDLRAALVARARDDYPAPVQHLLICDAADIDTQAICQAFLTEYPHLQVSIMLVAEAQFAVATKITKLRAALPQAEGDVLCFVDDDVILRSGSLKTLARHLLQPGVGSVFGLACYVNWNHLPSSMMSAFVNANALLSYLPITYLTEPFTITGHLFALRHDQFKRIGGLEDMDGRIDDDHELARRCQRAGLRLVQTPLVYDVTNELASLRAYAIQMRRWFVFPKQAMLPMMHRRDQAATLLGSLGNLVPGVLLLLSVLTGRRAPRRSLLVSLLLYVTVYLFCERRYLERRTPLRALLLLPIVATLPPLEALWALWSGNEVVWRGQRLRVYPGGRVEAAE